MTRSRLLAALIWVAVLTRFGHAQTKPEDKHFDSKGVKIHYVEAGRGEPVVLIHGFDNSIDTEWLSTGIFDALSKDFRVIALDCRGHGKSDKPHDPKQYGSLMVEDVANLLDHLNIGKAHIVGYSMGGNITAKFLTMYQDRVLTATLGGSSGRRGWTAQNQRDVDELATSLEHHRTRSSNKGREKGWREMTRSLWLR